MTQLIHKFLSDDERARTILASLGIGAGFVLLVVAIFATFALK